MSQFIKKLKPLSVNTDTAKFDLKETESTFLRGYEISFGKNGEATEGGNFGVGKKMPSNFKTITIPLPNQGKNKTIGFYESVELNEAYVFNWNSNNLHGIYCLDGNTLTCSTVCIKSALNFSIDPKHSIPDHRVTLRVVYGIDANGERIVIEKYLIFTDGFNWQRWIPIKAAIATNGFDADVYPYYKLQPPHFDEDELIDYVSRPPMYAPVITPVLPVAADLLLPNRLLKQSVQFAYRFIMTDNRPTAISWNSEPYFSQPATCDINKVNEPRCLDLTLYAGSPNVEKIQLLVRFNGVSSTNGIAVNTDWALYDTIYKFSSDGGNDPSQIGVDYWTRTNPWGAFNYNAADNTIVYRYCGEKGTTLFAPEDAVLFVQNDIPLKSVTLTNTGDVLLWGDNLRFYPNFPKTVIDNIGIDVVDIKSDDTSCLSPNSKITLYATYDHIVVSYKNGPADTTRHFGVGTAKNGVLTFNINQSQGYGLTYGNNDGLICYLAGTAYYAIGKQFKVDQLGNKTELGIVDITNLETVASILSLYENGGYVIQQFDFSVPAGNYIARLARHGSDINGNYQLTSTYVLGLSHRDNLNYKGAGFSPLHEYHIDATLGNVDVWNTTRQILFLTCPRLPVLYTQSWRFIEGYLTDNIDSISGVDSASTIGVELVQYHATLGHNPYKVDGSYTDHNGFFFVFTADDNDFFDTGTGRSSEISFNAHFNCGPNVQDAFRTQINIHKKSGYYPNQNIKLSDVNANLGNFIEVKGSIVSCSTGIGISGVGVTMSQSCTYFTDSNGNYSVRVHTIAFGNRLEKMYINGNGNCLFNGCDCSYLAPIPFSQAGISCTENSLIVAPIIPPIKVKIITISGKSLKGGGNYPVSIIGHDLGGRKSAACLIGYAYVPTFLEKNNFNPSQIKLTISNDFKLPDWVKWVTFAIGNNLNTSTYIQWVGDSIAFLDTKGNVVADGNGAVRARITIQSLLDFNIKENFNTTAKYQFVQNDTCRIYDDGQGNLFTPAANKGYLDYQVLGTDFNETVDPTIRVTTTVDGGNTTTATTQQTYDPKSFIIEYDERLLALKDLCGFWIELNRANPVISSAPFLGVTGTYPVINGKIKEDTILLNAFDTYYQQRNINISGCSGADLNHPFESQSITDFWGDNVTSGGTVLFKDDLAQQRWYLNDVIKTDAFSNLGRINGLGICRSQNRKDFTDQDWGGMVAVHAERNFLVFICQNDWFTCDFQLNYAHVDQFGRVIANPDLATGIGNPYQKIGDIFGCAFEDTATIQFDDGQVIWADRKNSAFILNNFRQAVDLAMTDNKGYFIEKFKFLQRFNESINNDLENIIETCAGLNPENGKVYITFRKRNGLNISPVNFINNEREVFYGLSETFIYDRTLKKWSGWAPFTPEFYGKLPHAQSGSEFITFANGNGWFHNSKNTKGFMNFYGVDTDQVISVVSNFDQSKLKIFQSIAIESSAVKYFISRIMTDDDGLFSYVPLSYFKKKGNVWYAELLRNMNTYPDPTNIVVSMLIDGKSITGEFCEFQIVSNADLSQQYSELNNILVRFIGSEKSEK